MVENIMFSVVVPVYNVELYLCHCVDSLLHQNYIQQRVEVLLIDDGSKDQSGIICDRLAEQFSNIKVIHKENGGLSSARNIGIEMAIGEYLLFVDSDDFIENNTFYILNETLKKYGKADVVIFDGIEDTGNQKASMRRIPLKNVKCTKNGKEFLLEHYKERNMNVEACLYLYRRQFLLDNGLRFQNGILHEDVEFTPRALLVCGKIIEIPDKLYHYMIREGSISTQKNREKNIRDLFYTLEKQCQLATQEDIELRKWMKNAALDSYLNMVQEARMYQRRYRKLLDKRFLLGKSATSWNKFRVIICLLNVRLYCWMNDSFKNIKAGVRTR